MNHIAAGLAAAGAAPLFEELLERALDRLAPGQLGVRAL